MYSLWWLVGSGIHWSTRGRELKPRSIYSQVSPQYGHELVWWNSQLEVCQLSTAIFLWCELVAVELHIIPTPSALFISLLKRLESTWRPHNHRGALRNGDIVQTEFPLSIIEFLVVGITAVIARRIKVYCIPITGSDKIVSFVRTLLL